MKNTKGVCTKRQPHSNTNETKRHIKVNIWSSQQIIVYSVEILQGLFHQNKKQNNT